MDQQEINYKRIVTTPNKISRNQFLTAFKTFKEAKKNFEDLKDFDQKLAIDLWGNVGTMFDIILHSNFQQSTCELIETFMFQNIKDMQIDGTNIDSPEKLWDFVKNSRVEVKN